jgi:hypothetical protein
MNPKNGYFKPVVGQGLLLYSETDGQRLYEAVVEVTDVQTKLL